jgi:hypothetical protein
MNCQAAISHSALQVNHRRNFRGGAGGPAPPPLFGVGGRSPPLFNVQKAVFILGISGGNFPPKFENSPQNFVSTKIHNVSFKCKK